MFGLYEGLSGDPGSSSAEGSFRSSAGDRRGTKQLGLQKEKTAGGKEFLDFAGRFSFNY